MSSFFGVFVGPYAEFLIPEDGLDLPEGDKEEGVGRIDLWSDGPSNNPDRVDVDGKRFVRLRFWSEGSAPGTSGRVCGDAGIDGCGAQRMSDVNPHAEIHWFKQTKAAALALLATHFGLEPEVHWGMVWYDGDYYIDYL
jgi:hypothetical protein